MKNGNKILFIHGLEGSPQGRKVKYLKDHFGSENLIVPAWRVSNKIEECLEVIENAVAEIPASTELIIVGSSMGGLLATQLVNRLPNKCKSFVLINPAVRPTDMVTDAFVDAGRYPIQSTEGCPTTVLLGNQDTVCPPELAVSFFGSFSKIVRADDDHRFSNHPHLIYNSLKGLIRRNTRDIIIT